MPPAALPGPAPAHAPSCENCGAPLQGEYCHACGQAAHNPMRHFGHAIEDVFESFWHLDGKIFRTLRDLCVPGRVAANYLAGQRVRYMPPLRLFVILTLFAFFVGKLSIGADDVGGGSTGGPTAGLGGDPFAGLQTVADVEAVREAQLQALDEAAALTGALPGAADGIETGRNAIRRAAARRIAELTPDAGDDDTAAMPRSDPAPQAAAAGDAPAAADPATGGSRDVPQNPDSTGARQPPAESRTQTPDAALQVAWLPGFAERWLDKRIHKARRNLQEINGNPAAFVQAFFSGMPTALFVLMPVFALLLKLAWVDSGRGYLEHLVVALYSHCWLMLVLLATFLLGTLPPAVGWLRGLAMTALWIWTPVYLLLTQRRVYGGGLLGNLVRYALVGSVYFWMVLVAAVFAAVLGIST